MAEIGTLPAPAPAPQATLVELVDVHKHRGVRFSAAGVRSLDVTASFIKGTALDNVGIEHPWEYTGAQADGFILFLNKANLSLANLSENSRILNKLNTDGKLTVTVSGNPD